MNNDTPSNKHVAVVILNYNSEQDLITSAPQLSAQTDVKATFILVDNASRPESVAKLKEWLAAWRPDAVTGTQAEVAGWVASHPEEAREHGRVYFITHHENRGYSAGNNVGICLSEALAADAVLIANPDMRFSDLQYIKTLSRHLFAEPNNYISASRVVDLTGENQNPLREPSFLEELFWPRFYFTKIFRKTSYVLPTLTEGPVAVPKVSGCCLMIRMSFLRATQYFDENVFLYCEEPILSARVQAHGGKIIYVPACSAIHAHRKSEKGNSSKRMLMYLKSRRYYLKTYSRYSRLQVYALSTAYALLGGIHFLKMLKEQ